MKPLIECFKLNAELWDFMFADRGNSIKIPSLNENWKSKIYAAIIENRVE
jgi:hypothetical protein